MTMASSAQAPTAAGATSGINAGLAAQAAAPALSSSSSSLSSQLIDEKQKPFWHFSTPEIERWVRQLAPGIPNTGGMLFPCRKTSTTSSATDANLSDDERFSRQTFVGNTLLSNLTRALDAASSSSQTKRNSGDCNNGNVGANGEPNTKRIKIDNEEEMTGRMGDIYQILDPSFAKQSNSGGESQNTTELSTGSILSRITLGGLVNALSGMQGGVVDTLTCIPLCELSATNNDNHRMDDAAKKEERKKHLDVIIETAHNLSLREVIKLARGLHRSIAAR
jgi:hypothetical protein